MFTLELTEVEKKQLIELIDIAVKATGLGGAAVGYTLAMKIQAATEVPVENKKESD